ncbi:MAG: SGNH/GDSL hydrolase family protein [Bacteroidota bacterium]
MNTHFRSLGFGLLFLAFLLLGACEENPSTSNSFLALGDSYTIGESVDQSQRWSVQLTDSLQNRGIAMDDQDIIAKTGWTTADLQEAIKEQNPHTNYDLVSLLIGVNNQYQDLDFDKFEQEFEELLKQAISFADGNPENVFVVSIPDYGVTPYGQQKDPDTIAEELKRYNETAKSIAEQYEVSFVNITPISKKALDDPDLTADDGLHPSGEMYGQWVQKILPQLSLNL